MSIRTYGNMILREKARPVTSFDVKLEQTVEEMKLKMAEANGVGLAANQVGLDIALFVAKLGEEVRAFANPTITPLSTETQKDEEGCLSVPGVWVDVPRYQRILLKAQDINGNPVELELEDYLARVVQHEVDHLNGILIIDRISLAQRRRVAEQLKEIRNNNS